jgi:hypothetical protein
MIDLDRVKNDLSTVGKLFEELLCILETEGNGEVSYAKQQLKFNISQINEVMQQDVDEAGLTALFDDIKTSYKSMFPPRSGLTESFIWREEFNERLKANQCLDKIKEKLRLILG